MMFQVCLGEHGLTGIYFVFLISEINILVWTKSMSTDNRTNPAIKHLRDILIIILANYDIMKLGLQFATYKVLIKKERNIILHKGVTMELRSGTNGKVNILIM